MKAKLSEIKKRCIVDGDCWLWRQSCVDGIPVFADENNKKRTTRRWIWEHQHGPIAASHIVMQSCGEPLCCSPKHLFVMSRSEKNTESSTELVRARMSLRRKSMSGQPGSFGKKYPQEIISAILSSDCSNSEAAEKYGVNRRYVWKIRNSKYKGQPMLAGASVFTMGMK